MFAFNPDKYEFWEIYECISHFYPIGVSRDHSKLYNSYPGMKKLEFLLMENIHNAENFKSRWGEFYAVIENKIKKPVVGTTYSQTPSFSFFVKLEKNVLNDLTHRKIIHVFVSLLGPFYTIIGQDTIKIKAGDELCRSISHLTVSPLNEYTEIFNFLCEAIEKKFTHYRFVPFAICKQTINGLEIYDSNEPINTIFNALFNSQIDLNARIVGNEYFKDNQWIKKDYVDNGPEWTLYAPRFPYDAEGNINDLK